MGQLINQIEQAIEVNDVVGTTNSDPIDISGCQAVSIQAVVDVDVPDAVAVPAADVDVPGSSFLFEDHGFTTGLKVAASTDDTLPAPLTATNYYVIVLDDDNFQVAASLADALAGTFIALEDDGEGITTFTPAAISGASVKFQKSNDRLNWTDNGSPTNITVDAAVWVEWIDPTSKFIRIQYTLSAGRLSSTNYFIGKGLA